MKIRNNLDVYSELLNKTTVRELCRAYGSVENAIKEIDDYYLAKNFTVKEIRKIKLLATAYESDDNIYDRDTIRSPEQAYEYCKKIVGGKSREHFIVLLLDTKAQVITHKLISIGTVNASFVEPILIFKEAIKFDCKRIILSHNHPSGIATPSEEDLKITKRLVKGGEILGIDVMDHIIVGDNRYTSFKRENLLY